MKSAALVALLGIELLAAQSDRARRFRPEDMFNVRRVGAVTWAPDGRHVAIELSKPARWLDSVPTSDISVLDVTARTLRRLSPASDLYVGFFNTVWSPSGRRAAFLSVDAHAVVGVWIWTAGTTAARRIADIDVRVGNGEPPIAWLDDERLIVMAWDVGAVKSGLLHVRILRGQQLIDAAKRGSDNREPSVSIVESGRTPPEAPPSVRMISIDLTTGARKTLARGRIHRPSVSEDRCCINFLRQAPGPPGQPVASYIEIATKANDADPAYTAVNWGTERHTIDARTGGELPPAAAPKPRPPAKLDVPSTPPQPGARQLAASPKGDAALYVATGTDGSRLWVAGGGGRPLTSSLEIWRANQWMSTIKLGRAEPLTYTSTDGVSLNAWLLLPPDHIAGTRVPVVTVVYPGTVHGSSVPASFSPFQANFEHPQLLAALGYAVLVPSMPEPKNPSDSHALEPLLSGVIPAIDAAVERGFADRDRVAILGQSDGGFAVLGLIVQTNRFRSAIASAGFSNFVSLYGTFYGQHRYGDGGRPEAAQVFRMLQHEQGAMGLGGPPWAEPGRYRANSPIHLADKVTTPLMLIHGELDFIPIQQAEEFFTALFRQDKRATLLRYAGENHTIAGRANVLDMWRRLEAWLAETLSPRE
jgi:dipeptidyl aminopeptidase/acylaminoacyl peptidase